MMSEGMMVLLFAVILFGSLPALIAAYIAGKDADPMDERQKLIRGKAFRDAVPVIILCCILTAIWFALRLDRGLAVPFSTTAILYLILIAGVSFYFADCIVRNVHIGVKGDKKVTERLITGISLMGIALMIHNMRYPASESAASPASPAPFSIDLLLNGYGIYCVMMIAAVLIRKVLDRKSADEETEEIITKSHGDKNG